MLIYVRSFVNNKKLAVEVQSDCTVRELNQIITRIQPEIEIRKLLFSGKVLSDDEPLAIYNVQKECTIQLMGRKIPEVEEEKKMIPEDDDIVADLPKCELNLLPMPFLYRQDTDTTIKLGDVLIIDVLKARDLVARDWLSGKSDPYVMLSIGKESARTRVVDKNLSPEWNETFGFVIGGPNSSKDKSLSVMCFDHDYLSPDDFLGIVELPFDNFPHGKTFKKWIELGGMDIAQGEILISVRRSPITSPELLNVLTELSAKEVSWNESELMKYNVNIRNLTGELAWTRTDRDKQTNPALKHLSKVIKDKSLVIKNDRTLKKVETILFTQKATIISDVPSRYLWICGLNITDKRLYKELQRGCYDKDKKERSERDKKDRQKTSLKSVLYAPDSRCGLVVFKRAEDAVLQLIRLYTKGYCDAGLTYTFGNHAVSPHNLVYGSFVLISGPHRSSMDSPRMSVSESNVAGHKTTEWKQHFMMLTTNNTLCIYASMQHEPVLTIDLRDSLILTTGPWSLEVVDTRQKSFFYMKNTDSEEINYWKVQLNLSKKRAKRNKILMRSDSELESFSFKCKLCSDKLPLKKLFIRDNDKDAEDIRSCIECLSKRALKLIDKNSAKKLSKEFSLQDLQDILSPEQFQGYLNMSLKNLIDRSSQFGRCPKCETPFELDYHTWSTKQQNEAGANAKGLDNRPMSSGATAHYLTNRIRCRNCDDVFCQKCQERPYHTGFNCKEYVAYKKAPHCRFCETAVMPGRNQMPDPPSPALEQVCDQKECVDKASKLCTTTHSCGHFCGGLRGESKEECLPCLKEGCENNTSKQHDRDICSICVCDDLASEACIQIKCGHVFHSNCVRNRLTKRWPGQRIGFKFKTCPLCNAEIVHSTLNDLLDPVKQIEEEINEKIRERVEIEDLNNEERVTDPSSRYHNDAFQYGKDVYAFYSCNMCEKPFFGGRRDCEANADGQEAAPEELVCNNCSELSAGNCDKPEHQDYILWKCRFCCSGAVWFCWGTTHFCDYCHSNDPWGRAKGEAPQQSDKAKCPPNGQDKCPILAGNHPASGTGAECEFAIGCGLCRDGIKNKATP